MKQCFVIQPFSGDFDKRYTDTFEPAIKKTGLEPYRVDKDLSSSIPINDIEEKIRESTLCFADITTDNPNVWYELGYAYACGKDVVMVCSEERTSRFPFDIQHKNIIKYKTGSKSDFEKLENDIELKLIAYKNKSATIQALSSTLMKDTEGLQAHEVAFLALLMSNLVTDEDSCRIVTLKNGMEQSGYNSLANNMASRSLQKKGYIVINLESDCDQWGNEFTYYSCKLTRWGVDWIFSNQNKLEFKVQKNNNGNTLPF